ncbi:MAG: phosphomethylpyrimidine synthase ThiC [Candidatus Gastranaerophilales bacterium]|nr:phosphomethylpyrimidine synthase ThiC [Candidatus Gastranaerophilales bacterium]
MTTQMQDAKCGIITDEMRFCAEQECVSPEVIRNGIANGRIVILKNNKRIDTIPVAVGENLKVKINANINTANKRTSLDAELDKLRVINQAGAHVLMDFSSNKLIDETRQAILSASKLPVGTMPVVQAGVEALNKNNDILNLTKEEIFNVIEKHCSDGADFICLHCALNQNLLKRFQKQERLSTISSHAATMLACWMKASGKENPLYEYFDELLDLVKPYDVTLLLQSAFKSGSTTDASDGLEVAEAIVLGELVTRARELDVQVMIEGIEQAPLNKIPMMVQNIKELSDFAPLYVSGAIACDCAVGYDNISSAIGGALAAYQGADMLKATTSVDRIGFSHPAHIREGIMSAKIAAHCADLARGISGAISQNYKISFARKNNDWQKQIENSLDKTVFDGIDLATKGNLGYMCANHSMSLLFDKYFSK